MPTIKYADWIDAKNTADYYSLDSFSGRLSNDTIIDALDDYLGDVANGNVVLDGDYVIVNAFRRRAAALHVQGIAEHIMELLDEEYSNPDSYARTEASFDDLSDVQRAVDSICSRYESWACELVADIIVSEEDIVAMLNKSKEQADFAF